MIIILFSIAFRNEANESNFNLPFVGNTFATRPEIQASVQNICTIKHKSTKLFVDMILSLIMSTQLWIL